MAGRLSGRGVAFLWEYEELARGEGFLADELAAEDADAEALGGIGSVKDFDFGAAGDEKKFFVGAEERDAEVVFGGLAILHFDERGFVHGEEDVVGAGFVVDQGEVARPFRGRSGGAWLGARRLSFARFDDGDEAVAAAGKRLDIARGFGGIAEHFAKPRDGVVKAMVEIDEGVGGPNLVAKLLAGHDIAGAV